MYNFEESNGFFDMIREMPLFFKLFGGLLFLLVIGIFLFIIIKGLSIWISNNNSDVIKKKCKIVDKRTEVWGGSGDSSANTNYYITFEFEDKTRIELFVHAKHYGLLIVGDIGDLSYQGTRFNEFSRLDEEGKMKEHKS